MNLKQNNNLVSGREKTILISFDTILQVIYNYKSNLSTSQDILDPPRSSAKAGGGQGGYSRQPTRLPQGQALPAQLSGILWLLTALVDSYGCYLPGVLQSL